jgi:hypothetical protein
MKGYYRPVIETNMNTKAGTCRKFIDGKVCGVPFVGPPRRKYCDAHSSTVTFRGKGSPQKNTLPGFRISHD